MCLRETNGRVFISTVGNQPWLNLFIMNIIDVKLYTEKNRIGYLKTVKQ